LFEPVTSTTATAIANEIVNALTIFEPRVQIVDLQVIPYPDQYLYVINLALRIPTLKQSFSLQGTFQGDAITIL
jgi:phage baseplate assembly protein W